MSHAKASLETWPALPWDEWRDTCAALQLWSQIAGKYRLAHAPWVNHSWHATLYVTPRGLTTALVPDGDRTVTLDFDVYDHLFIAEANGGASEAFSLESMSVADFFARAKRAIRAVGGTPHIHGVPNEVANPIPFEQDTFVRPYDAAAVERFHEALLQIDRVFELFRTSFLGKVSPVHLFWGSFDLAVTRFSGRRAPLHPGGMLNLPDAVTREAYSHEVSSAGFWPGGNGVDEAMFYSYAYPEPEGFRDSPVSPAAAHFDERLGEFLLPYAAVQSSASPEAALLEFLETTYEAAADNGRWDRAALECELGVPGTPRPTVAPDAGVMSHP